MTNKSGLRYKFKISYSSGPDQEITTKPIDAIVWEKQHAGKAFQDQLDVSRMLWIAWNAGRRSKQIEESTFEKWAERIEDFDADEDVEPDPTNRDRSESSTPDSPSEPAALPAI